MKGLEVDGHADRACFSEHWNQQTAAHPASPSGTAVTRLVAQRASSPRRNIYYDTTVLPRCNQVATPQTSENVTDEQQELPAQQHAGHLVTHTDENNSSKINNSQR
ncbi:MAG: hypothetical protein ACRDSH_11780, partial [Pseudonocardiaceae bacterium]